METKESGYPPFQASALTNRGVQKKEEGRKVNVDNCFILYFRRKCWPPWPFGGGRRILKICSENGYQVKSLREKRRRNILFLDRNSAQTLSCSDIFGHTEMEITCLWDQAPAEQMFLQDTVFGLGYPNSPEVSLATASLTSSDVNVRLWGILLQCEQSIFYHERRGWDRTTVCRKTSQWRNFTIAAGIVYFRGVIKGKFSDKLEVQSIHLELSKGWQLVE